MMMCYVVWMNPEAAPLYSHPNIPVHQSLAGGYYVQFRLRDRRGVSVWMNPYEGAPEGLRYVAHENEILQSGEFLKIPSTMFETHSASAITEYIDEIVERTLEPSKLSDMMLEIL